MAHNNSRLALDIEEIERQLRQARPAPAGAKGDPLAELARIVGQDDPFRTVFSGEAVNRTAKLVSRDDGFGTPALRARSAEPPSSHDSFEHALCDAAGRASPQADDSYGEIGRASC